jgi:[acyl-carrier-protein] S-malonyltransferase
VLVCSVAAFRELSREQTFTVVAGHSVGEYGALVASEAIAFEDALTLIATRAAATADIAHRTNGTMAALLKVDVDEAARLCSEAGVVLAADNAAGQCVISGPSDRIDAAIASLEGSRAVAKRLEVDGAFHSPLMEPAVGVLRDALSSIEVAPPKIDFWSSTTATPLDDPETIRRALLEQLVGCVRWRETVERIAAQGHSVFADVGPGRVVGTLARRIVPSAEVRSATDLLHAAVAAS